MISEWKQKTVLLVAKIKLEVPLQTSFGKKQMKKLQ